MATELLLPILTEAATSLAHVPAAGGKRARLALALVREPVQALLAGVEAARVERLKSLSSRAELLHMALLIEGMLSLGEGLQSHADAAAKAAKGAKNDRGVLAEGGPGAAATVFRKMAAEVQASGAGLIASLADAFVRVALVRLDPYSEYITAAWITAGSAEGKDADTRSLLVTWAVRHLTAVRERVRDVLGPACCALLFAEISRRLIQDFAVKVRSCAVDRPRRFCLFFSCYCFLLFMSSFVSLCFSLPIHPFQLFYTRTTQILNTGELNAAGADVLARDLDTLLNAVCPDLDEQVRLFTPFVSPFLRHRDQKSYSSV